MQTRLRIIFSFLVVVFFVSGCTWGNKSAVDAGYIIVTVSGLSADELDESVTLEQAPHLDELIKESIKFTHAYTTSTMESAAMASMLTGLYPWEHGVRYNGASLYKPDVNVLPEILRKRGFSSFFISGGAPFLRKSAISFGFDEFDDRFKTSGFYLNANDVVDKAIASIEGRPAARPYIGFLYFADFLYFENINKEKKIQQMDAAIYKLKKYLIKQKLWDGVTFLFVGLRGAERTPFLYDDVTRIPLLIKPASKPRDLLPSWKIDGPVTLADLGRSLFGITGTKKTNTSEFSVVDFSKALQAKEVGDLDHRTLLAESTSLFWKNMGPLHLSLRQEGWVYFPVDKKLFNTYTDRFQTNNLFGKEKDVIKNFQKIHAEVRPHFEYKKELDGFNDQQIIYKLNVAKVLFDPLAPQDEKLRLITEGLAYNKIDKQIKDWFLDYLYEKAVKPDPQTEKLISKLKPAFTVCTQQADWVKSGSIKNIELKMLSQCNDSETLAWLQAYLSYKQNKNREANILYDVAKNLSQRRRELDTLSKNNWLNGLTWDFPAQSPSGVSTFMHFLKETDKTDFSEFVKKKPNL